jgi:hypothetical protein
MAQAVTAALDSHRAATRGAAIVTAPNGLGTASGEVGKTDCDPLSGRGGGVHGYNGVGGRLGLVFGPPLRRFDITGILLAINLCVAFGRFALGVL